MKPKALVLAGDGINCSNETRYALEFAGFDAEMVHTSDLLEHGSQLFQYKLMALPVAFPLAMKLPAAKSWQ